eukprot:768631-Hanusia_phi.AAC.5
MAPGKKFAEVGAENGGSSEAMYILQGAREGYETDRRTSGENAKYLLEEMSGSRAVQTIADALAHKNG